MKNQTRKSEEEILELWYKHCKKSGLSEVHPSNVCIERGYARLYNANGEIGRYDMKNNKFIQP